jgi:hypothetical protein
MLNMGVMCGKTPFLKYMGMRYRQFLPNVSRETSVLFGVLGTGGRLLPAMHKLP